MPFLWFSEGIFIELDFESETLILKAVDKKGEDFYVKEIIQEIPLRNFVCLPINALRNRYVRCFAANLAEYNFGMLKTAKAIREQRHHSLITKIAMEEGHRIMDTEINNLLFRENWEIETSYQQFISSYL